ncbi:MAG: hypothetical protein KC645_16825, partial [Gemmatimonadetes bacterium]|nr:hypothetical protein [Gemmatimonadota bacterium]
MAAQQRMDPALDALAGWVALDVPTGYERRVAPALAEALDGWSADAWGNLVLRTGSGSPRSVIACALDAPAYAASQITEDGYLRLHRIGRGSDHPLWDQAHEAQQVRILTADGPVAGVVANANGHFAQQHRGDSAVVGADDLWVDVGAEAREDVAALGTDLLDPVVRHWPAWALEGAVAGPSAGARAGCAAVATVAESARRSPPRGEHTFVLSAQEGLGWVGLSSLLARGGAVDQVVVVAPGAPSAVAESRPAGRLGSFGGVLAQRGVESVRWLAPAVEDAGALSERIRAEEALRLRAAVAEAAGVALPAGAAWVDAPARAPFRTTGVSDLDEVAALLERLVELHAVPSHEWAVRRAVLEALPAWARERAVVDDVGNVIVEAGPDRDTTVFMAHMDEVGYEVESVAPDGVVTLGARGGAVAPAWEGQTALLHFDPPGAPSTASGRGVDPTRERAREALRVEAPRPPLRGVFLTRDAPASKWPDVIQAWFGLDGPALAALGVGEGSGVTSHKEGLRLGRHRFTARALD